MAAPRHDCAALYRHAGRRRGAGTFVRPRQRSSAHYFVFEDGRVIQMVPGEPARLARRRRPSGPAKPTSIPARSASKSPIRVTTTTIPIFPDAPDRGCDRAVPRHPDPKHDSAGAGAGAFRRRAVAQAGSGREISVAHALRFGRRPLGQAGADHRRRRRCWRSATAATPSRRCRNALREYGYGINVNGNLRFDDA